MKIPQSVLVVIHTPALEVLLIERADAPGFWQSVTGSKDFEDEAFEATAVREVREETGLDARAPGHVLSDWDLDQAAPRAEVLRLSPAGLERLSLAQACSPRP